MAYILLLFSPSFDLNRRRAKKIRHWSRRSLWAGKNNRWCRWSGCRDEESRRRVGKNHRWSNPVKNANESGIFTADPEKISGEKFGAEPWTFIRIPSRKSPRRAGKSRIRVREKPPPRQENLLSSREKSTIGKSDSRLRWRLRQAVKSRS